VPERAAQVDARRITVEMTRGKVILRGEVKTWAERDERERAARAAPGVFEIENDIRIAAQLTSAPGGTRGLSIGNFLGRGYAG
jgi:hypothetical protein